MKKAFVKLHILSAAVLCTFVIAAPCVAASANSAQTQWSGSYATGMLCTDEQCPVVVERELLTFDLQQFPSNYYESAEEFLAYDGKVTAQYTFYNPADYTVEMTLAFPFGEIPSYGAYIYDEGYDEYGDYYYNHVSADDTEKYAITSDGEEIEKTVRHTYSSINYFKTEEDVAKLCDAFKEDDFLSPDMTIYEYVVRFTDVVPEQYRYTAFVSVDFDAAERRVFSSNSSYSVLKNGGARLGWWVGDNDKIYIYSTDRSPENLTWNFYTTGTEKTRTAGKAEIEACNELTFKQFALEGRGEESSVSETDWYNAVVDMINEQVNMGRNYFGLISLEESSFMRWYVYTLTIQPHERLVNEVAAPVYPTINLNYTPGVFMYTYLLSPAKTWAEFGELEVVIDTPFYIVDDTLNGFTQTESGYACLLDGLPEGELRFALSTSSETRNLYGAYAEYNSSYTGNVFIAAIAALFVLPVFIPAMAFIVFPVIGLIVNSYIDNVIIIALCVTAILSVLIPVIALIVILVLRRRRRK